MTKQMISLKAFLWKNNMALYTPTNSPPAETIFLKTPTVCEISISDHPKFSNSKYYYIITDINPALSTIDFPRIENQLDEHLEFAFHQNNISIIDLAKSIFAGSKPLDGEALEILQHTAKRIASKIPIQDF